ncbi:hypothetical protein P879_11750 [Paragonimus westermani]|uniref:Uncharacterized protein n=1 Tax=Paragonimus westermani TaxID=34504 RepID=A0A8T0DCT4_9TREM|nr:hypothetical protein P879_11750 [Paragonimus westermani]
MGCTVLMIGLCHQRTDSQSAYFHLVKEREVLFIPAFARHGLDDIYATYSEAGHVLPNQATADSSDCEKSSLPALRHTNFLKHVERSSCLLLVLDASGFQRNQYSPWRSPLACAYILMQMLERWSGGFLLEKPFMCVLNKVSKHCCNTFIGSILDDNPSVVFTLFVPNFFMD